MDPDFDFTFRAKTGLIFEQHTSRSVYRNQRDELYLMAASRASDGLYPLSGGSGAAAPCRGSEATARAGGARGGPLRKLQDILFIILRGTFIKRKSFGNHYTWDI